VRQRAFTWIEGLILLALLAVVLGVGAQSLVRKPEHSSPPITTSLLLREVDEAKDTMLQADPKQTGRRVTIEELKAAGYLRRDFAVPPGLSVEPGKLGSPADVELR
jgi:hypothetical protein